MQRAFDLLKMIKPQLYFEHLDAEGAGKVLLNAAILVSVNNQAVVLRLASDFYN